MFNPGDVVRLKSGRGFSLSYDRVGNVRRLSFQSNPKMTVELRRDCELPVVGCIWFVGSELKRDDFLMSSLVHA